MSPYKMPAGTPHIKNFEGRIRHEPVVRPQMTVTDPRMTLEPLMTISRHNRSILGATAGTSNFNDRNRSADEGSYFSSMRLLETTPCLVVCDLLCSLIETTKHTS